jgi:O-Antigen ligase
MSMLVLVPCLICLYLLIRGRAETAFLWVYLPIMILFPQAFSIRLPHLPDTSIAELTLFPLGMVAFYRLIKQGRPVPMDFLVGGFLISLTVTEVFNEHVTKDGIFIALLSFNSFFLPYAIGRTMIEPGLRLATVKRLVILFLLLGLPGVFEWRMGHNLYGPLGQYFGVTMSQSIQIRGGRGRFSAAFTDSEIAGIAVGMIVALNAWLVYLRRTRSWENPGKLFLVLEKYHIAGFFLLLYVFLTQSRGPQLALAIGFLILQIPRFKNTKLASAVVAIVIVLGAIGAYRYFIQTTDDAITQGIQSEQQGSALYRRRMLELFQPVLDQGGWLGWGYKSIPHAEGLGNLGNGVQSVDNEFLYVNLAQGRLGWILFLLIAAESVRTLALRSYRLDAPEDRAFTFSMLAAMAVLWIALATVYMGDQLPQLAFLLIGWSQSIEAGYSGRATAPESAAQARFAFKRVLT